MCEIEGNNNRDMGVGEHEVLLAESARLTNQVLVLIIVDNYWWKMTHSH